MIPPKRPISSSDLAILFKAAQVLQEHKARFDGKHSRSVICDTIGKVEAFARNLREAKQLEDRINERATKLQHGNGNVDDMRLVRPEGSGNPDA